MEKYQLSIPLPSAGINYRDDSLIGDNESAEGTVNISFKDGMPKTRKGYIKKKPAVSLGESGDISRLYIHTVGGRERVAYAVADPGYAAGKLWQYDHRSTASPGDKRALGSLQTARPSMIPFAGGIGSIAYSEKTLVLTGAGFKYFDDDHSLTDIPAYSPTAEEIEAFGTNVLTTTPDEIRKQKWIVNDDNRLWVAGNGNLVRLCHLGAAGAMPNYWPSLSAFKLQEDCTGMARFMGEVVLFTRHTATLVEGSTPVSGLAGAYENKQLPGGYGCESAETIAIGDNSLYWANRTGIYRYTYKPTGYSIPECVSEFMVDDPAYGTRTRSIRAKLDAIENWNRVFAVFHDHEYRLYIGNGEVLVFDSIMASWTLFRYYHSFSSGCDRGGTLYYGSTKPITDYARIYRMDYPYNPDGTGYDGLSDDGHPFTATLRSKFFDFGKSANRKRFGRFYFTIFSELVSYDILLTVNMDNQVQIMTGAIDANKVSRWGNNDPDDDASEGIYAFAFGDVINADRTNLNYMVKLVHTGKRYNIQYDLTTTGLNQAWTLKDIVLMLKVKELK